MANLIIMLINALIIITTIAASMLTNMLINALIIITTNLII